MENLRRLRHPDRLRFGPRDRLVAGVDEAGRGPWAGPVVAAAVMLRRRLRGVRVDDSKRLTALQRQRAYQAILAEADVGVGIIGVERIDTDNIRRATLLAMQQAIATLPAVPALIMVDGHEAPEVPLPCHPMIRGDQRSYPIACASIVAKVTRDSLMTFYDRLFPAYRFRRHKGYGTQLHLTQLHRWGPSVLHRLSVQPVALLARRGDDTVAVRAGEPAQPFVAAAAGESW